MCASIASVRSSFDYSSSNANNRNGVMGCLRTVTGNASRWEIRRRFQLGNLDEFLEIASVLGDKRPGIIRESAQC